ncbi:hypothetical protein [Microvirga splendida]|uniref:Uncharacterized protein n=1 Tax=Microvirga splendida TaxID=2795727 RepID=A0ABS0Y730_9HYPH|nr:hypothetical protein [Microvirga splendida]MBJ6128104.1 hypothetical protein [Microvirga splendida]
MTDHLQSPVALHRIEFSGTETDAERLARMRRALREAEKSAVLVLAGSFDGDVMEVEVIGELTGLLLEAPLPVFALPSGFIGPRGLPILLAADRAMIGSDTSTAGNWRNSPALTVLLHHRLGPLLARAILFSPESDLLAVLTECGFAIRSSDPAADAREVANGLAENGIGRRFKRSLKASTELPLKEALAFDVWSSRKAQGGAP